MKRFLGLFMALLMAVAIMASAAAENTYDEHMVFTFASGSVNESTDYNGDELSKFYEDKFNFEWDIISLGDDGAEKIRIWINAGNMPDVVAAGTYNNGEVMNYIDQELLYRFPDDWKERWPNAAAAFELTSIGDAVAEKAGGTYIFPRAIFATNYPAEKIVPHYIAYIRKDWAQAVGFELKDAYKVSELLELARLFKEKDPGQVGDRLIPIALNNNRACYFFMLSNNAYAGGADTSCLYYKDANGAYQWGPASEETLTGLKLYHQAYEEGLLNPEFYSYAGSEHQEDFYIAGVAGITLFSGMASYFDICNNGCEANLGGSMEELVHTATILGEDGYYHGPELLNYSGYMIFRPDIPQEKFERFMDLLDYAATTEGQMTLRMGFKGTDWDYDENGEIVSFYEEGQSARSKYASIYPIYHRLVVMSDDFTLINPAYKKEYRDRIIQMYCLKNELASETSIAPIDWDVQMHTSDAMSRISFDWGNEYATLILMDGDLETNWKNWVSSNAYLIDPVLKELNEQYAK